MMIEQANALAGKANLIYYSYVQYHSLFIDTNVTIVYIGSYLCTRLEYTLS